MSAALNNLIDEIKGDVDELASEIDPNEINRQYLDPIEASLDSATSKLEALAARLDLEHLESRLSDISETLSELKSELAETEQESEQVYYGRVVYTYKTTAKSAREAWNLILSGSVPVMGKEKIGMLMEEK